MSASRPEINRSAAIVSITDIPVLILVGVTGVGKSTTLAALDAAGFDYMLLPDRRQLTDDLIIARLQAEDGETIRLVTDRAERFDYTRRYRERYGGGMAHALTSLRVDSDSARQTLLFDGLRGVDEVRYAADHLPLARFLVLDAQQRPVLRQRAQGDNDPISAELLSDAGGDYTLLTYSTNYCIGSSSFCNTYDLYVSFDDDAAGDLDDATLVALLSPPVSRFPLIEGFSIDGSFEVENDRDIYDIRAVTTTGGLLRVDVLSDDAADDDTWFALRDIDGALLFATTAKTTRSRPHAPTDRRDTLYLDLGAHPDAVFLDAWSRHGVGGYYTAHLTAAREEQRCRDARDCVAGNACLEMHDPAATPTTWTRRRAATWTWTWTTGAARRPAASEPSWTPTRHSAASAAGAL
jgi:hypothetical protein